MSHLQVAEEKNIISKVLFLPLVAINPGSCQLLAILNRTLLLAITLINLTMPCNTTLTKTRSGLTLYYTPLSMYSRPVWLTLLEKNLDFELVSLKLNGDQWQPEFLEINPFNHVPVLVDDGFRVFESLAILDYIEAKYPTPTLLPTEVKALALVRMVEMVTMNELVPASLTLIRETRDLQRIQQANRTVKVTLTFLEENLRNSPYLGSQTLTFADIVAGAFVTLLPYLNISVAPYPNLATWFEGLMQREGWKIIQPNPEVMEDWIRRVRVLPRVRRRQYGVSPGYDRK